MYTWYPLIDGLGFGISILQMLINHFTQFVIISVGSRVHLAIEDRLCAMMFHSKFLRTDLRITQNTHEHAFTTPGNF